MPELVESRRGASAAVCIMAGRSARSIVRTLDACERARDAGLIDDMLVVGKGPSPELEVAAREAGAGFRDEAGLLPDAGPVHGKGDAMWRALEVLEHDLIAYCDADLEDFGPHFLGGLLGPLLTDPGVDFVKATYHRPLAVGGETLAGEGGRVTELLARPLLEAWFPEAATLRQPLSGEVAARRDLLTSIPYATGYAVEAVMLVDVIERAGLDRVAEVDLGTRHNDHQPLEALGLMAREILVGLSTRMEEEPPGVSAMAAELEALGRVVRERPAFADVAGLPRT
ncbi:MAG: glucosyl-3-phosphoglycerate synthase [Solirubrobacterales bacterium]|nr:glucosyl-3-phosphoglycerate synthase [Solirubrobacterales bacterium]MCB1008464.1 glucosyl-3-phosphoglycerate synthase [Acidobacteriota bacterium]